MTPSELYKILNFGENETVEFKITLFKEKTNEGINEGIKALLNLIQEMPGKRSGFYSERINVPQKTVERWLSLLKNENMIEFSGSKKTGGYYIKSLNK